MRQRTQSVRVAALLIAGALLAAACGDDGATASPIATNTTTIAEAPSTVPELEPLRLNDLTVLGSHNSYHQKPADAAYAAILALSQELAESIDYSHRSLSEQLEVFGVRQFEIDVFADPDGGLYSSRAAMPVVGLPAESGIAALDAPGFKVMHTQDFDFETNCLTLQLCLAEIRVWSDANPDHFPLMVMIEVKEESVPEAAEANNVDISELPIEWTIPVPTTSDVMAALDAELLEAMTREKVITPDDVRGSAATLEEVILADGWPTLADSRGKVMFSMVNTGEARDIYRIDAPSLEGRMMFTTSDPGSPDAAFLRVDDPVGGADEIALRAAEGYLIRTRTDSPTADARTGDTTRRDAAFASGAHYLSTDYYAEDPAFETGYVVVLEYVCNPVSGPTDCPLSSELDYSDFID